MIEDHYGHVTPVRNADRILQGMTGWQAIPAEPEESEAPSKASKAKKASADRAPPLDSSGPRGGARRVPTPSIAEIFSGLPDTSVEFDAPAG